MRMCVELPCPPAVRGACRRSPQRFRLLAGMLRGTWPVGGTIWRPGCPAGGPAGLDSTVCARWSAGGGTQSCASAQHLSEGSRADRGHKLLGVPVFPRQSPRARWRAGAQNRRNRGSAGSGGDFGVASYRPAGGRAVGGLSVFSPVRRFCGTTSAARNSGEGHAKVFTSGACVCHKRPHHEGSPEWPPAPRPQLA